MDLRQLYIGMQARYIFAYAVGLLLLLCSFYLPWLANRSSFYLSDITYYFEPLLRFIGQALKENRIPLWNQFVYCGMSQIAVPSPGVFYPLNWFFAFLPFNQAFALVMVAHQWIAGLGAYFLIESFSWGWLAAAIAGFTFALGGYMFSLQSNFTLVATVAWVPLCCWSTLGIGPWFNHRNVTHIVLSSLFIALMISAGRPEIFIPGLIVILTMILACAIQLRSSDVLTNLWMKVTFWRLFALTIGLLLSMPTVLPALEWTLLSPRAHGLQQMEVLRWSANWYDYLCLFLPQPLGDLNLLGSPFLSVVATRSHYIPYLSSAFIGPVAVTLAIWGMQDKNWKLRWFVLIFFAISVVFTLGKDSLVLPWFISKFSQLAILRYPVKLIICPVWCLIILSARGTYLLWQNKINTRSLLVTAFLWLLLFCTFAMLVATSKITWLNHLTNTFLSSQTNLKILSLCRLLIGQAGIYCSLIGLATCLIVYLKLKGKLGNACLSALLITALVTSLLHSANCYARHATSLIFFNCDSVVHKQIEKLKEHSENEHELPNRILSLYFDPLTCPVDFIADGLEENTSTYFQYGRQLLLPNTNIDFGICSPWGYEAAETEDYHQLFNSIARKWQTPSNNIALARFCQMTSTQFVLTQMFDRGVTKHKVPILDERFFHPEWENNAINARIYRVKTSLPRAYLTSNWKLIGSHASALNEIIQADKFNFNPNQTTLIEPEQILKLEPLPREPIQPKHAQESWVEFLKDKPESIALSIKAHAPSFLILTDHFYPGWIAKVDGVPANIHHANALFRAVFVAPGSHLVEFDYQPQCLSQGISMSVIGFSLCALLIIALAINRIWIFAKEQSRG